MSARTNATWVIAAGIVAVASLAYWSHSRQSKQESEVKSLSTRLEALEQEAVVRRKQLPDITRLNAVEYEFNKKRDADKLTLMLMHDTNLFHTQKLELHDSRLEKLERKIPLLEDLDAVMDGRMTIDQYKAKNAKP